MASLTVFDAFQSRLAAWETTPVIYENEFYDLADTPTPFVYVEVFGDEYNQDTLGAPQANHWLETGATYIHVMTPSGQGSRLARQYANSLLYLFREQAIGTLFMPQMSIGAGDPGRDFPGYFAMTASIFWSRRDITSIPPES